MAHKDWSRVFPQPRSLLAWDFPGFMMNYPAAYPRLFTCEIFPPRSAVCTSVYSGFLASDNSSSNEVERPYTFSILGEKSRDEVQWFDLVRGEKIAGVGLGGVGAWIADLLAKADVAEVHGWDADVIEEKNIIRMPGAVNPCWIGKPKAKWFEETYGQIHHRVFGHAENVTEQNAKEVCANTTFGFVAVDDEEGREIACNAMAEAETPFIDIGIALDRRDGQVTASIRLTTAWPHDDAWRKAIPKVDKTGQEVYGKLEFPDIAAIAAGWAVQSWRKMRGQMAQDKASECMVYRAETKRVSEALQQGQLERHQVCELQLL